MLSSNVITLTLVDTALKMRIRKDIELKLGKAVVNKITVHVNEPMMM